MKPLDFRNDPAIGAAVKRRDRARGHRFQPPAADAARIPPLVATGDTPLAEKIIYLHYFTGSADWYVAELDPDTGVAFAHCDLGLGFPEWGYVDLRELATVEPRGPFSLPVERDLHWSPKPFSATRPGRAA